MSDILTFLSICLNHRQKDKNITHILSHIYQKLIKDHII